MQIKQINKQWVNNAQINKWCTDAQIYAPTRQQVMKRHVEIKTDVQYAVLKWRSNTNFI